MNYVFGFVYLYRCVYLRAWWCISALSFISEHRERVYHMELTVLDFHSMRVLKHAHTDTLYA